MAYAYRKKGKWALLDDDSTPLTDYRYDLMVPPFTSFVFHPWNIYSGKNFVVAIDSQLGILDHSGREIVPCLFEDVTEANNTYLVFDAEGVYWLDELGKPVLTNLPSHSKSELKVKKWWGREYLVFESAMKIYQGDDLSFMALRKNEKWGVYTIRGEPLLDFEYDDVSYTWHNKQTEDFLFLHKEGRWIAKKFTGQTLFELNCDSFEQTNCGLIVEKESGYGLIDYKGIEILPAIYEDIIHDGDDNPETALFGCLLNNQWTLYNGFWNKISEDSFEDYDNGDSAFFIGVKKNGWGAIDYKGNWMIPPEYEKIYTTSNGHFILRKNGKYALYSQSGAITGFEFDSMSYAYSGKVLCIEKDYKLGLMDYTGNIVVQPRYVKTEEKDEICFFEGRAQVSLPRSSNIEHRSKYFLSDVYFGFIDEEGSVAIPIRYELAYPFTNGLSRILQECIYYKKEFLSNGKYGIIDTEGNLLVPPKYDWILDTNFDQDKFILVVLNWNDYSYGWIDKDGREYFEE